MNSQTINKSSKSEYTDRGSKFLGFLIPINSAHQFRIELKNLKNVNLGATHVCRAYRLYNLNRLDEKASDDGEPSGSAGIPILNELKRRNIVNVGMFVVRHYGGRKLGIPGLVHSYTETTRIAISNNSLSNWELKREYVLNHSYQDVNKIDFLIKKYNAKLISREFDLFIKSHFEISDKAVSRFELEIESKLSKSVSLVSIK